MLAFGRGRDRRLVPSGPNPGQRSYLAYLLGFVNETIGKSSVNQRIVALWPCAAAWEGWKSEVAALERK